MARRRVYPITSSEINDIVKMASFLPREESKMIIEFLLVVKKRPQVEMPK